MDESGVSICPLVSIIIPFHNRANTLENSIQSVLNQSYTNIEVIAVDDGSEDDFQKVFRRLLDKRLKLIHMQRRGGACRARNMGAEYSTGEIIAFQDSDDIWLTHKLATMISVWRAHKDSVIFSPMILVKKSGVEVRKYNARDSIGRVFLSQILVRNHVGTSTLLMKKSVFSVIGGFDVSMKRFQDWEFVIRAAKKNRMIQVDEPLVIWRISDNSISKDKGLRRGALRNIRKLHEDSFKGNLLARFIMSLRLMTLWIK